MKESKFIKEKSFRIWWLFGFIPIKWVRIYFGKPIKTPFVSKYQLSIFPDQEV